MPRWIQFQWWIYRSGKSVIEKKENEIGEARLLTRKNSCLFADHVTVIITYSNLLPLQKKHCDMLLLISIILYIAMGMHKNYNLSIIIYLILFVVFLLERTSKFGIYLKIYPLQLWTLLFQKNQSKWLFLWNL